MKSRSALSKTCRNRGGRRLLAAAAAGGLLLGLAGVFPDAGAAAPAKIQIINLGDSYAAGTGASGSLGANNQAGSSCYQAKLNAARLLAQTLQGGAVSGYTANDDIVDFSCAGALTNKLVTDEEGVYIVDPPDEHNDVVHDQLLGEDPVLSKYPTHSVGSSYGNLEQKLDAVKAQDPSTKVIVLLSIGGNDLRFSPLWDQCFLLRKLNETDCRNRVADADNKLDATAERVGQIIGHINALLKKRGLAGTVMLEGLPYFIKEGTQHYLGSYDLTAAMKNLMDKIDQEWRDTTVKYGARYVSLIAPFRGYEPYNGMVENDYAFRMSGLDVLRLHPNDKGQEITRDAILAELRAALPSIGVPDNDKDKLLAVSPTGKNTTPWLSVKGSSAGISQEVSVRGSGRGKVKVTVNIQIIKNPDSSKHKWVVVSKPNWIELSSDRGRAGAVYTAQDYGDTIKLEAKPNRTGAKRVGVVEFQFDRESKFYGDSPVTSDVATLTITQPSKR
ncbi:MAG: hypothetical protein LBR32_07270 [Propionibacteriaceae bacterium]|jgi:lysophospholipase L1-like esterase|nr:hypothetical protein [Propionibacteriaceae bacterium]